jgi:gas vesicle protein
MNYERSASVSLYFLLGGLAGAAIALVLAPRSGSEMRQLIGDKVREGQDIAGRAVEAGRDMVQKAASSIKRRRTDASGYENAESGFNGGEQSQI